MSSAVPGYAGKFLRVDLTQGRTWEEGLEESVLKKHIGGLSLGAKYLYDEVDPKLPWNDPDNRLIIFTGPLEGTKVDGTGSFSVTTKGPITGGAGCSQANGFFGAYLKFCGYDGVIFQGAAKDWVYLYIDEKGKAELKDARHLVGKDTWETEDAIKAEVGKKEKQASVFSVGLAGENLVRFAAICGDKGHVAGHNGIGAVMGSKKLKAFGAARGRRPVVVKDAAQVSRLVQALFEQRTKDPVMGKNHYEWGTSFFYGTTPALGQLPVKNLTTTVFPEAEKFTGAYYRPRWKIKPNPCWACRNHHCYMVEVTEGPYAGFKGEEGDYEIMACFGSLIGQTDAGAATMLSNEVDRLGLEGNEAGWLMSWLIECYERGLITREQTDGLEMTWGNVEAVRAMLRKIARREGFGNFLADGIMRCCEKMGGEARECGVYLKKGTIVRNYDVRAGAWREILDEATSVTGFSQTSTTHFEELGLAPFDAFSPEQLPATMAAMRGKGPLTDSLVVCIFTTGMVIKPLVDILNAVTGWDLTLEEALNVGVRGITLLRAFELRSGVTPDGEMPSGRLLEAPTDGPAKGKTIKPYWGQLMDNYYRHMGWDRKSGRPLPETLSGLGLGHVVADLWGQETPPRS